MSTITGPIEYLGSITIDGSLVLTEDSTLDSLSDVDAASPDVGDVLVWDGARWVASPNSWVVGRNYDHEACEAENSTTDPNWKRKVRLETENLPYGEYRIGWSYEWRQTRGTRNDFKARVRRADAGSSVEPDVLANHQQEAKDAGQDQWHTASGFGFFTGYGVQHIDIDYCSSSSNETASIRRARLEIWRVK